MNSPALLTILLAGGVGVAGIFYGIKERNAARLAGGGGAGSPAALQAAEEDIAKLLADLDAANKELEGLKDENRNMRHELNLERETVAQMLAERDRMIARFDSHRAGGLPGADGRDWTDEEIDLRNATERLTVRIREQTMSGPLGYRFTDWPGMREALAKQPGVVPEAGAEAQSRAYAAMGFVPEGTDVRARTLDLLEGQLGAALYDGKGIMLFNSEGTPKSIHDRTALAVEITRWIQDGNFKLMENLTAIPHNEDFRQALWSLAVGDSNLVKIRFQLQDTTAAAADELLQSPTKMTREQFERIPAFLREYYLFPFALGERFCQVLHESGRWERLNKALISPPWTTAEILHPELFTGEPRFKPEQYLWMSATAEAAAEAPLWDDVAGELRIALLLNQSNFLQRMAKLGQPDILDMPELVSKGIEHFAEREGSKAAAGWAGDRFLVFPAGGDGGHVYWRTKWRGPAEADEFEGAIRKSLAFRHGTELAEGDAWTTAGARTLKVARLPDDEVLVIDAGDAASGARLEELFKSPPPAVEAPPGAADPTPENP